jgi:hypothetical protein
MYRKKAAQIAAAAGLSGVTSQVQVLHQACTARERRDRDEALRRWSGYLKTRLGGAGCGAAARGRRGSLGLVGGVFGRLEGLEGCILAAALFNF